jgi:UDP-N-acetylglucosamine 3-dehydrogenase
MMKVGVIGVGSMGQNHARVYSEIAQLAGVYDAMGEQARKIADRFSCAAFDDVDELLKEVDAVSVCTPTSTHHEVALKAIAAGVDLLVEKPFTGDVQKAKELETAAAKAGVVIASGFIERFNPIVGVAREAVAEGSFGRVISLSTRRVSSYPARIRDVGVVMDLGIHDVDVMRHVTGSEVTSVYALGGRCSNPDFEDHANLLLRLESGAVGFLEANWLTPMKVRKMSLTCGKSFVQVDYTDQSMEVSSSIAKDVDAGDMFHIPLEMDIRKVAVRKEEPLKRELQDFLSAADKGRGPNASAADAISNLRVCEGALASLASGNVVHLKAR